jgi:hypothetical protein
MQEELPVLRSRLKRLGIDLRTLAGAFEDWNAFPAQLVCPIDDVHERQLRVAHSQWELEENEPIL